MSRALRLTTDGEPRPQAKFDRFAWERWLISSGAMAQLKPAERAVLWMMAIAADRSGESYWSLPRLAEATGYQDKGGECRAVRNARRELHAKGLIELVEQGGGKRASRYRIVMQHAAGCLAPHDVPGAPLQGERPPDRHPGTPVSGLPQTGTHVPPTPERTFPPARNERSGVTAHRTNHGTAAAAPDAQVSADVALWDSPTATARAAAAALVEFGFSAREAAGIVSQHKPTAEQVRTVIANARAWQDQHASGDRPDALRHPKRFVARKIAQREYEPDPAVAISQVRQEKQSRHVAARQRAEQLEAAWSALSIEQREQLKQEVLERIREKDQRRADYYATARAQDEPLRSLIAALSLQETRHR